MVIDPKTALVGTVGWMAADADIDVRNADDLAYLKEPSVVLGHDRQWRWLPEFRSLGERVVNCKVYDNWLDALEAGIAMERRDITDDRQAINAKLIEMDHREARLDTVADFLNAQRVELDGNREGCTRASEHIDVQREFTLPINLESGDQHYLTCTLSLHYGTCKCGGCVPTEVVVSDPISGTVLRNDHYEVATADEVAELFELAKKIDQDELRDWFH